MLRSSVFSFSLAVLALALGFASPSQAADKARGLVTQPINNSQRITLMGNTRPEATRSNDRGAVSDNLALDHMQLLLQRPAEREQALNDLIGQQHDPKSPNYHKWLTAAEFGKRFGVSDSDVQAVTSWLTSQGFKVNTVYSGRTFVDFSGTAAQVRTAFGTEMHSFSVDGKMHVANVRDPQVPAALAPAVSGIVSLNDFHAKPQYSGTKIKSATPNRTFNPCPFGGLSPFSAACFQIGPADLQVIYNLNPVFSGGNKGGGETIVLIEDTNIFDGAASPAYSFWRSTYNAPGTGVFTQVQPPIAPGITNCGDPGVLVGNDFEAVLDVEYSGAAAPDANLMIASCKDTFTSFGGLIAFNNLVNSSSPPPLFSISYGSCETFMGAAQNKAYNDAYAQAVAEGASVFVSSGDQGASQCDRAAFATHGIGASGFASTPYDVAVGGTDFGDVYAHSTTTYWNQTTSSVPPYGSALSYIPEVPWNSSCAGVLTALFATGSPVTYGANGFCNSGLANSLGLIETANGSGAPSGCATGHTSVSGVVSGTCRGYAKPSWQKAFGVPADKVRDTPDVSLFSSFFPWGHGYFVRYCETPGSGSCFTFFGSGGTSFASPIWAGIQALVNHSQISVGNPDGRQGNPNPVYYALANAEYATSSGRAACNSSLGNAAGSSCTFYDVTLGDIDVPCSGTHNCYRTTGSLGVLSTSNSKYIPAYGTTKGYDLATGIGTVNAVNLINNWP